MQEIIIRSICKTLLHSLWQGLLLAAIAAMLMMVTKKSGSAFRYKILCSLLIVFIAGISFTFCKEIVVSINPITTDNYSSVTYKQVSDTNFSSGNNFISADNIQKLTSTCAVLLNNYSWLLVLIWFLVSLFHFVKLLLGMVNAERMRYYKTTEVNDEWNEKLQALCGRMHIIKPVLLMESALLKVPVLIGYVKPVILIPVGMLMQLSGEQVEAILLHELAHVRRHDYLVNLIQNAIETIFFFNPGVLWISSLVRSERENCCDDIAIIETKSRKQFVEALVSFNQYSDSVNTSYSLSWISGKGQLLHRVQRIVNRRNNSLRSVELIILMVVLLLTGTAFITLRHTREILMQTPTETVTKRSKKVAPANHAQPAAPGHLTGATNPAKKSLKVSAVTAKPALQTVGAEPANDAQESAAEPNDAEPMDDDLLSLQKQMKAMGNKDNDLGQLRRYMDHGVSAEYIQSILSLGYSGIPMEIFVRLKDHGVNYEFLSALKKQGYAKVDLDQAVDLLDHGVSPIFIEGFRKLGFKNINLEEATRLKDHGVSTEFIELFKKKTGQYLFLEDYIKLKDSGISPV